MPEWPTPGFGQPPDWSAARKQRRTGASVFHFYNLMPVLSAVENVELPLLVGCVRAAEARRRALAALDLVGVADRAAHRPDALSGGQRQRVTIARALVNDPAIVWADELTGDLDSESADDIVGLMRRLNLERSQWLADQPPGLRHQRDDLGVGVHERHPPMPAKRHQLRAASNAPDHRRRVRAAIARAMVVR